MEPKGNDMADPADLKPTHLMDWLLQGYVHCRHGTQEWCESYLRGAHDYIVALEAARLSRPSTVEVVAWRFRLHGNMRWHYADGSEFEAAQPEAYEKDALFTHPQAVEAEWRPVVGFEDGYEVSSDGDIRSKKTGLVLAKNSMGKGYVKAALWAGNNRKQTSVHRVVAEAFLPRREDATEVNHLDGDKTNNRASNLEWTDRRGNTHHSRYVLGNDVKAVLATDLETGEVEYYPSIEEAGRNGYRAPLIYAVLTGRRQMHGGRKWEFTEWRDPATHPSPQGGAEPATREQVIAAMSVELQHHPMFRGESVTALVWATRIYDAALRTHPIGETGGTDDLVAELLRLNKCDRTALLSSNSRKTLRKAVAALTSLRAERDFAKAADDASMEYIETMRASLAAEKLRVAERDQRIGGLQAELRSFHDMTQAQGVKDGNAISAAEQRVAPLVGALALAQGRLELLLSAELPESDHPSATKWVLKQIYAALATEA